MLVVLRPITLPVKGNLSCNNPGVLPPDPRVTLLRVRGTRPLDLRGIPHLLGLRDMVPLPQGLRDMGPHLRGVRGMAPHRIKEWGCRL